MTGRLLAQLSRLAAADARAAIDPRHTDDDVEGDPPFREITRGDVRRAQHLTQIAARCQVRSLVAGYPLQDDPFASDEENERRRVETWDRVF